MSAQAAKVLRRDLRRAVGAEAIGVIDHNAQLLADLQQQVARQAQQIVGLQAEAKRLELSEQAIWNTFQGFFLRSLLRRLRWLVTGT